jgi:hypothetical protein
MEPVTGVRIVNAGLTLLRDTLQEYAGQINEIRAGLKPDEKIDKPEALILYEQCKELGIPLVKGSLLDQPHIWMLEYKICDDETKLMAAIHAINDHNKQGG